MRVLDAGNEQYAADQLGGEHRVAEDAGQPERSEELRRAGQREDEVLEQRVGDEHVPSERRSSSGGEVGVA